jgi:hypothetical protein
MWTYGFATLMAIWFAVVVPAHERGAVVVPGAEASSSCCPTKPSEGSKPPCHDDQSDGDPVRRCALCQFLGTLDVAAAFVLDLPPAQIIAIHNASRPTDPASASPFGPGQSRAPPA